MNEKSRNFKHRECDEHFFPDASRPIADVDGYAALPFYDFGGLISICAFMVYAANALATAAFSGWTHILHYPAFSKIFQRLLMSKSKTFSL